MRTQISKFALAAALGLALTFTLSCSSGSDDNGGGTSSPSGNGDLSSSSVGGGSSSSATGGGGSSSSVGGGDASSSSVASGGGSSSSATGGGSSSSVGGGSFNENSQVYNNDGSLFTGSEVIKIKAMLINAGNITNGIVNLQLPTTIPDEYLTALPIQASVCTDYIDDVKAFFNYGGKFFVFGLTNGSDDITKRLEMRDEQSKEQIIYVYFSKAGKITCNTEYKKFNIQANLGWTKIYYVKNGEVDEFSTNNILTKEIKWILN